MEGMKAARCQAPCLARCCVVAKHDHKRPARRPATKAKRQQAKARAGVLGACIAHEDLMPCRRDVQDELHANISGSLPGPWKGCNQEIQYST